MPVCVFVTNVYGQLLHSLVVQNANRRLQRSWSLSSEGAEELYPAEMPPITGLCLYIPVRLQLLVCVHGSTHSYVHISSVHVKRVAHTKQNIKDTQKLAASSNICMDASDPHPQACSIHCRATNISLGY